MLALCLRRRRSLVTSCEVETCSVLPQGFPDRGRNTPHHQIRSRLVAVAQATPCARFAFYGPVLHVAHKRRPKRWDQLLNLFHDQTGQVQNAVRGRLEIACVRYGADTDVLPYQRESGAHGVNTGLGQMILVILGRNIFS